MYIQYGENNINSEGVTELKNVNQTIPYDNPSTPEVVENASYISLGFETTPFALTSLKYLKGLAFNTQLDFIFHQNKDNIASNNTEDIQLTLGIGWSY